MIPEPPTTGFRPTGTLVRHAGGRVALVAHRLRVIVVAGPDSGKSFDIDAAHAVVGNSSACDIVVRDPEVSRRHCAIEVHDGAYRVRDLDSTNGTFLEGVRVSDAEVPSGGRLRLGSSELVFSPKKKFVRLEPSPSDTFAGLVGTSPAMRELFGLLNRVAPTRLFCVLRGETGTGKEVTARAVHQLSPRSAGPFVVVDCASITESLAEAELLGHERGAFTGADRSRPGPFEVASGGTVFLDEVGDLPLSAQPKLLRVLERREIKRLGASKFVDVDVRVIAATHRDLESMVRSGAFREDLYFRLAEVVAELPPLRDRRDDIAPLTERLLVDETKHGAPGRRLSPDALALLQTHDWPGNVRELRNVIRRAAALASSEVIVARDLQLVPRADAVAHVPTADPSGLSDDLAAMPLKSAREVWNRALERAYVLRVLERTGGDVPRAAHEAGIHLKSFQRLMRQLGIPSP